MSVHVEWLSARETSVQLIAPGEEWVGAEEQPADTYVLTLAGDDVTAIVGTRDALRQVAVKILEAVTA